ncbi:hypothetical protein QAD02_007756 [Eretmocerus hayati]|uniref:Uncharacterized protein n=1 Tax=Eretmocerus hayati TaxID=131215 RepID=A0ACC2N6Y8_9HYME|nr:hypothetical protein QAD02_007756 [Eretmocerus hayati]
MQGGKASSFPSRERKTATKRSLVALKERMTRSRPANATPETQAGASRNYCRVPTTTERSTARAPERDALRDELSPLSVITTSSASNASTSSPLPLVSPESFVLPETASDVDQNPVSDPWNKSMTSEEAHRFFAPTYATTPQPEPEYQESATTDRTVSEQADSTTQEHRSFVCSTPATMYEIQGDQIWSTDDHLVDHFRLLEAIAPMEPRVQAVHIDQDTLQARSCDDDEFLSTLLPTIESERPSLRMTITREPSVTSSVPPEGDEEQTHQSSAPST